MSHFSVLCVGDVDYNMAPFHEYECDGIDDEFVEVLDITEDKQKDFQDHKLEYAENLVNKVSEVAMQYNFKGQSFREFLEDYCGYTILEDENSDTSGCFTYAIPMGDDNFKVFRKTNPNAKYDYYGSGWKAFKLKPEVAEAEGYPFPDYAYTNNATFKDIDVEGMFARQINDLRERYHKIINKLGKVPEVKHKWEDLIPTFNEPEFNKEKKEEAIKLYNSQPDVILWGKKIKLFDVGWNENVEDYACTEDEFVKHHSPHALAFAMVKERKWCEKGEMGYWAIVTNEKTPETVEEQWLKFWESLDPEDELTMLDCHI